ncbi:MULTISPECIES: response regulator transcription factor [Halomonadaceae]|uniref:Response regulator transcription factor n=1 Tax=Vreelandella janggokensis TaxID=370767 RepID=A0ABT4IQQ2_9GAMM|nr:MULTISPECIES: response regulator transcription factor [Halomonas]MCW4149924.1 response regulator transcription factor [Halomonas sp. 18H]MCZ0926010.1 response regulator transcription factor [Halomonas janggokensis]MCZ0931077.1 response regulator transcription factor [Halomonas janggokensis]MDR5886489.1 response regulator transcription factor [Halomonas janggokensis]QPL46953.1 response regulator transcription factor [Halomonas sp. A40-4]
MGNVLGAAPVRVLIVEDNRDICENIAAYLEKHSYVVDFAYDGISAMYLALTNPFDVIVLDLMLPGMDGLSFCTKLRADAKVETPVLMLTARDTLDDKLKGFEAGADDYLVKPFALQELHARLQALCKRSHGKTDDLLTVGDLTMNRSTLQVHRAGQRIDLTPAGMRLLQRLMEEAPSVVARDDLETLLWAEERPDGDALRSHLYKLRQAIDRPFNSPLIHTVHRIGYRIAEDTQ